MKTCPDCPESELEMYEHYDEYNGETLRQEQHFECPNCHRTFICIVWYKETDVDWLEEDE